MKLTQPISAYSTLATPKFVKACCIRNWFGGGLFVARQYPRQRPLHLEKFSVELETGEVCCKAVSTSKTVASEGLKS